MKWWAVMVAVLAAAASVVLYVLMRRRPRPETSTLDAVLRDAGQRVAEARHTASIEVIAARQERQGVVERLNAIKANPNVDERRQRVLALYRELGGR